MTHEFAHIFQGHVLLCEQSAGRPLIAELNWQASGGVTTLVQQALEYDADRYSVNLGFGRIMRFCDNLSLLPDYYHPFFADRKEALFTWLFAVYSLFRIFGAGNYEVDVMPYLSHPSPRMRQSLIINFLGHEIAHRRPDLFPLWGDMAWEVFYEAEAAVAKITALPIDLRGHAEAASPEGRAHMEAIVQEYTDIKPELQRLKATM